MKKKCGNRNEGNKTEADEEQINHIPYPPLSMRCGRTMKSKRSGLEYNTQTPTMAEGEEMVECLRCENYRALASSSANALCGAGVRLFLCFFPPRFGRLSGDIGEDAPTGPIGGLAPFGRGG